MTPMRSVYISCCLLLALLFNSSFAHATMQKKSKIFAQQLLPGIKKKKNQLSGVKEAELSSEANELIEWTHPGLATFRDGKWIGKFYVPGLGSELLLDVEITQFEEQKRSFPEEQWKGAAWQIFSHAGFIMPASIEQVLPFFHLQIILYPFADGYVASLSGRLFQQVNIPKVNLRPGYAYQAIVWEKNLLIYHTLDKIDEAIQVQIEEMVQQLVQTIQESEPS